MLSACHAKRVSQEKLEAQDAIAIEKMALRKEHREQKDELQHLQTVLRSYQCDEEEHDSDVLDILRRHVRNEHDREQMVEQGHESQRNGSQLLWDMKGMLQELFDAWSGLSDCGVFSPRPLARVAAADATAAAAPGASSSNSAFGHVSGSAQEITEKYCGEQSTSLVWCWM